MILLETPMPYLAPSELPSPLLVKTGWPWEVTDRPQAIDRPSSSSSWPRMSIVTPSYNQGRFIEETIRSVLLQGYPNLEYIIIDGGSSDDTVEIIRKYEPWLAYWVSEPDHGQSHAINKGFRQATGDILAWLNSDDVYQPGALYAAAATFQQHPQAGLVYGRVAKCDQDSRPLGSGWGQTFDLAGIFRGANPVAQPSAFFRRAPFDHVGELDESLHFVMDTELWMRLGLASEVVFVDEILAKFRYYPLSKSGRGGLPFAEEWYAVVCRAFETWSLPHRLYSQRKSALARLLMLLAHEHHELADYTKARLYTLRALYQDPGILSDAQMRDRCLRYLIGRRWVLRLKSLRTWIQMVGR
jgi:glycosyltransferase involved in cell wall biosynthesis